MIFVLILVDMIVLSFQSVEYDWFEFLLSPSALFGFEWGGAGWLLAASEASSQLFEFCFGIFRRQTPIIGAVVDDGPGCSRCNHRLRSIPEDN